MCTASYLLIFPRDILLWLIGVLNTLNALFFAMIFVVYYCHNNFKVLMWFFFSLVIEVQNLFIQIIYEFASPCIDVLRSAEWLAPLFQFIFSYLLANNRLFLHGRCCSFRRHHLFTELQGVLNPLISQLSPIVPTLNVSNYLFFEGNCSVKSEHENPHQYMSFTNSVLTETKI